jgi:hypothetical protein
MSPHVLLSSFESHNVEILLHHLPHHFLGETYNFHFPLTNIYYKYVYEIYTIITMNLILQV